MFLFQIIMVYLQKNNLIDMGKVSDVKSIENYDVSQDPILFGTDSNYSLEQQNDLLRGDVFVRVPTSELNRLRVPVHNFLV